MNETTTMVSIIEQIKEESNRFAGLKLEINKIIVGNYDAIDYFMIALLTHGHVLLEGVPGVAKTTMIKSLAQTLNLPFSRIQFTPDLLPADLIGTMIFNPKNAEFETKKGPIFANFILADEINRAPAKVQSALLEAMQEQQVTIGSTSYRLDCPFLVFATQNPIEQEGTYRLPEAQLDRFMFKLIIDYPSLEQEMEILNRTGNSCPIITIVGKQDIERMQELIKQIYVDQKIRDYIVRIIAATRKDKQLQPYIKFGASPRATLAFFHAARALSFLKKRHFVTPDDIKMLAYPILRHRIGINYQAEAEGITADEIITSLLQSVPTP